MSTVVRRRRRIWGGAPHDRRRAKGWPRLRALARIRLAISLRSGYIPRKAGERFCSAPFGLRATSIAPGFPSRFGQPARGTAGSAMKVSERPVLLLRSVEDLASAKEFEVWSDLATVSRR